MKNPNIIVRIPEPCHEDWNKMTPVKKGRFCSSCSKTVIDFSNKMDEEISMILLQNKDKDMCGHFKKTQIDRPLNIKINLGSLPKNMSMTKVFAVALFLSFGTFLFSCTNFQGQKVNNIEIMDSPDMLRGAVEPDYNSENKAADPDSAIAVLDEPMVDGKIEAQTDIAPPDSIIPIHSQIFVAGGIRPYYIEVPDTILPIMDSSFVEKPTTLTEEVNSEKILFFVFPNPTKGDFTLKYEVTKRADVKVEVLSITGSLVKTPVDVKSQYEGKYEVSVSLNELPNGIYIVNLLNGDKRNTQKIVLEH